MINHQALKSSATGKSKRSRKGGRIQGPAYQILEPRQLLAVTVDWSAAVPLSNLQSAADAFTTKHQGTTPSHQKATHFYIAEGRRNGMTILSDRISIQRGTTVLAYAEAKLISEYGLSETRPLDGNFKVYQSQKGINAGLVSSLLDSGWANEVVPVFGILESGSEAVLLNEVIVSLSSEIQPEKFFSTDTFADFRRLEGTPDQFVGTFRSATGVEALNAINQLQLEGQANWVAPNFYQAWQRFFIPNDPRFSNLWHLHNTGQGGGKEDIDPNLPEAWAINPGGSSSIVIGVVDDGVSIDHPDLHNWVNPGEIADSGVDDDGNGWIDDIFGWNFVLNNNSSFPTTANDNHGTAVAGVAAARGDNGLGVTGAAYNSRVLGAGIFRGNAVAQDALIASAIYYASGRTRDGLGTWDAAHIVNHSWGGGGASNAINEALLWASTSARNGTGVLQVIASGNSFGAVSYPARLSASMEGVIAVGAINNFGEKSNYSNFGPELDIVTPSNDTRPGFLAIDTTDRVGAAGYAAGDYTGTGSTGFGGTSSATPLASGIGALAISTANNRGVELTAGDLKKLMRNNTKLAGSNSYSLATGRNNLLGYGLLNAETLLRGIGRAQIGVVAADGLMDSGQQINFGEMFLGQTSEQMFRIRNQGTSPLELVDFVSTSPSFEVTSIGQTTLGLGESTTFLIRFHPELIGANEGVISILSNDSLQSEFQIHVSGIGIQLSVSGIVYEDRNGDSEYQMGETGLADWLVFLDANGNGRLDSNLESNFYENAQQTRIFDFQTTESTIVIDGFTNALTNMSVIVDINHTYVSDLDLVLVAPNGRRVTLFRNHGGGGNNLSNTTFSDQAPRRIGQGTAPFEGRYRPFQPLSRFNNINPNGEWRLEVTDSVAGDQGFLNGWAIEIAAGEQAFFTDETGHYFFFEVPAGSYNAIVLPVAGWTISGPNSYPVVISGPTSMFFDKNFGAGKNNRFYGQVFNDRNGNGSVDAGESGLAERAVFLDNDFDGLPDALQSDYFNDSPVPIVDLQTVESQTEVSDAIGVILDLEVRLNIQHTWVSDMIITLEAPDGREVLLFSERGGNGQNLINTIFSDSAETPIADGLAPFTGRFIPEEPLFIFAGMDPNGIWKLKIEDTFDADQGVLLNWTLSLFLEGRNVTDDQGWFYFDLDPGQNNIQLESLEGWSNTLPANGNITVNTNGRPIYNQLFGVREQISMVVDSAVFYAGSVFDNGNIENAIDPGKSLVRQGATSQTLTFDNLTNNTTGINGLIFHIDFLASDSLGPDDFVFRVSPTGAFIEADHPPDSWQIAPAPSSITVNSISDERSQVVIQWPNNAIQNRWLSVSILPNQNTGLEVGETFFLGHLLGEVNGQLSNGIYVVSNADAALISNSVNGASVPVSSIKDLNKDGFITVADILAMLPGIGANRLRNITIPGNAEERGPNRFGFGSDDQGDERPAFESLVPPRNRDDDFGFSGKILRETEHQTRANISESQNKSPIAERGLPVSQMEIIVDTQDSLEQYSESTSPKRGQFSVDKESLLSRDQWFAKEAEELAVFGW
jgi:subtilisin-like proprotein convertase family protein/subtilisin family serine protease